ncbi:MAG: isocitrate lyase/phosphoenolpyruvate mutase family protein [Gemmatimonadetes bacterium]|nr:isocitrate lyase/phosphoenolpyruvate mutase family protein [Gemmatimonadota bacterium]
MTKQDERVKAFRELHESGCFVIPNPWDLGSAQVLVQLGFPALATTSSGFAWSLARPDNGTTLDQILSHARTIVEGVSVPVSVDFQDCYAVSPDSVSRNVQALLQTGVAGFSVEDSTRDRADPLFDFELAVERVSAAVAVAEGSGSRPVVTARTEGFIVGRPDLEETVRRLVAFSEAGADCLYAPGIRSAEEVSIVVEAVAPKPVNVLVGSDFTTVAEMASLGVRRISVGGALARVAWGACLEAAEELAAQGTFSGFSGAVGFAALDGRFDAGGGA